MLEINKQFDEYIILLLVHEFNWQRHRSKYRFHKCVELVCSLSSIPMILEQVDKTTYNHNHYQTLHS